MMMMVTPVLSLKRPHPFHVFQVDSYKDILIESYSMLDIHLRLFLFHCFKKTLESHPSLTILLLSTDLKVFISDYLPPTSTNKELSFHEEGLASKFSPSDDY